MDYPILSLVTGTRNRPESFWRLVRSIEEHTPMAWELVVSDASDTPLDAAGFAPNVRILPERPRLGCSKGYNQAFRQARGVWVIWLNDDCEVLPNYADAAIGFMASRPTLGLGALYYCEGAKSFHVNSYYGMLYANFGILRRELGNQIGWFDESLPMYGCDNAIAFSVLLAGYGIDGIPGARLIHHAIDDMARRENNVEDTRIREAEALRDKYGPVLPQIQSAYRATASGRTGVATDQTPAWMWPR